MQNNSWRELVQLIGKQILCFQFFINTTKFLWSKKDMFAKLILSIIIILTNENKWQTSLLVMMERNNTLKKELCSISRIKQCENSIIRTSMHSKTLFAGDETVLSHKPKTNFPFSEYAHMVSEWNKCIKFLFSMSCIRGDGGPMSKR